MTIAPFTLAPTGTVHFGDGALAMLPAAVGGARAFVVTDTGIRAAGILDLVLDVLRDGGIETGVFDGVEPNPSTTTIAAAAEAVAKFGDAVVVAVGGGSSLDAAKGIALGATNPGVAAADLDYRAGSLAPGLPIVAVPTTAGTGAETNGFGVIEDTAARCKIYLGNASTQPRASILDPRLTVGLPAAATAATGVDALVHGIESLTSRGRSPVSEAYAHHAVRLVHRWLPVAFYDGDDLEARGHLLLGAHLAGLALSISGLGLVHGIGHSVTAHTGAAHGLALAAVLDPVLEFNLTVSGRQFAEIAFDIGTGSFSATETANARAMVDGVRDLVDTLGVRQTLTDLGCADPMVDSLARTALADPVTANTPRMPDRTELAALIRSAL